MGIVKSFDGSTAAMRDAVHLDQAEWHADSAGCRQNTAERAVRSSQPFLAPPAHIPPAPTTPSWEWLGNGWEWLGMDPVS